MPAQLTNADSKSVSKKRKRTGPVGKSQKDRPNTVAKPKSSAPSPEEVLELEVAIVESPQNYNKIVKLLEYVRVSFPGFPVSTVLIICLRTRPRTRSWQ